MFFVYSEFFALFLYNLKKVVFKGGVFMLSTVTGGQWFFPLIIVCLILGIVATMVFPTYHSLLNFGHCRNHRSKEKVD